MSTTKQFDVNEYWLSRGRTYMEERRTPPEFHRLQEGFLLAVLERGRIPMRRVLELGCGFGRVTQLLAKRWPESEITALDLSSDQLANARRYCGNNPRLHFAPHDFYSGRPFPGSGYDTVIAIEVFLHHPAGIVTDLLKQSAAAGRWIVNVDWSEEWSWPTPEHVWVHDYAELYASIGMKSAVFPVPMKVDGKQQKLFIAAKDLSPELTDLEREMREGAPVTGRIAPPSADAWCWQLNQAMSELAGVVLRGSAIILVDDAQWGVTELNGSRVIPFLERDGVYWGPPDDDTKAWRELQRLRGAGATRIVFAWPSFWWLEHYREFHQKLRAQFRCLLENERLIVFALDE